MKIRNRNLFVSVRHLLFAAVLTACAIAFAGPLGGAAEDQAIAAAARKYVAANSQVSDFEIKVEKIAGNYARAKVIPENPGQTDAAWVFLKREKGTWTGLTLGTAFTAEDYKEFHIPAALRL
jgi:hypothetical protein